MELITAVSLTSSYTLSHTRILYTAQKYAPLMADGIASEISQDPNGTRLTVWWTGQNHSDGYIVVVGDDSCTTQGPCSIIKNTVSL